jgi:hypothetical protein
MIEKQIKFFLKLKRNANPTLSHFEEIGNSKTNADGNV